MYRSHRLDHVEIRPHPDVIVASNLHRDLTGNIVADGENCQTVLLKLKIAPDNVNHLLTTQSKEDGRVRTAFTKEQLLECSDESEGDESEVSGANTTKNKHITQNDMDTEVQIGTNEDASNEKLNWKRSSNFISRNLKRCCVKIMCQK